MKDKFLVKYTNCGKHDKMQLFAKFQKILVEGFRATLNFRKLNVGGHRARF